jgi:hypothetical protein
MVASPPILAGGFGVARGADELLKAVESLVGVRRLLTPMQITIAQNQINFAL